jgi:hypothetical protein
MAISRRDQITDGFGAIARPSQLSLSRAGIAGEPCYHRDPETAKIVPQPHRIAAAAGCDTERGIPPYALPQSDPPAERAMQASHLHKRNDDPHRVDHSTRAARGEKRRGRRCLARESVYRSVSCKHHDAAIRAVAFSSRVHT